MNEITPSINNAEIDAHILKMRMMFFLGEMLIIGAAVSAFLIPEKSSSFLGRGTITIILAVAALWLGFSSGGDARRRMERLRQGFSVHRDPLTLLRGHRLAYVLILFRIILIAVSALLLSLWGSGPGFGLILFILAFLLVLMTFPTEYKTRLLLKRASME